MDSTSRRSFLKLCIASMPNLLLANRTNAEVAESSTIAKPVYHTTGSLDRYIDPLPIPKRLIPYGTSKDGILYRMRMLEFTKQMHSQLPPTRLWGYEGQYPGPTIEAFRDKPIVVRWENHLPSQHIFEIDPRIHGAMPPTPAVRTVPHLHGARTRSECDGLPEEWFTPRRFGFLCLSQWSASCDALVSRSCDGYHALECLCGIGGILSPAR